MIARDRTIRTANHRAGFTLIEILLVMSLLSIALMLSVATILGAFRIEEATSASLRRQVLLVTMADRFRADVAGSVAAPRSFQNLSSGAACLILRRSDGRHIAYRSGGEGLERCEL